jgi:hypothetical protein
MATSDTGRSGPNTSRAGNELTGTPYNAGLGDTDLRVPRELREGASTPHPEGLVSPEVRSDSDGPLRGTGIASDRDSGLGASAGHDTGGEDASRNAQAALLRERADQALQRGSELASSARERLQRWQQMDAARDSLPGEHWVTLGAGLWLMTRRRASFLGQLLTVAAGAALVYRSMTGRDSLVPAFQQQKQRLATALQQRREDAADSGETLTPYERQERSSQLPM